MHFNIPLSEYVQILERDIIYAHEQYIKFQSLLIDILFHVQKEHNTSELNKLLNLMLKERKEIRSILKDNLRLKDTDLLKEIANDLFECVADILEKTPKKIQPTSRKQQKDFSLKRRRTKNVQIEIRYEDIRTDSQKQHDIGVKEEEFDTRGLTFHSFTSYSYDKEQEKRELDKEQKQTDFIIFRRKDK